MFFSPFFPFPPEFSPLVEPSAPPQDVKCVSTRSTAILVSWRPPPAESQNGVLAGYSVYYRALDSEDTELKEVNDIPPTTSQILLESLEKWTEYRITVVAHTEVGPGPESSPVIVRTDEDGNCAFAGFSPSPPVNTCPWLGGHRGNSGRQTKAQAAAPSLSRAASTSLSPSAFLGLSFPALGM